MRFTRWDNVSLETRFWSKVDIRRPEECWEWKAGLKPSGYGGFNFEGKTIPAQRVAWLLTHGSMPVGQLVCHTCDNPPCCNPAHLFLGSIADNNQDKVRKGRQVHGDAVRGQRQQKLNWEKVNLIREEYATGKWTQRQLARRYDVSQAKIWHVINYVSWCPEGEKPEPPPKREFSRKDVTPEQREKHRQARLRVIERDGPRLHTETSKAKLSAAKKGKPVPALQGHPVSAATREKIAASLRGKPRPPEVREKLRQASLADHARRRAEKQAETRRKMSEAATGNKKRQWRAIR